MGNSNIISGHDLIVMPYNIHPIELKITKEINQHSRVVLRGIVPEDKKEKYIHNGESRMWIEIKGSSMGDCLFKGVVSNIKVISVRDIFYVEIEGVSCTVNMDLTQKKRSFQNKDMSYTQLVNDVVSGYNEADFMDEASNGKKLDKFIIQYDETDWEFIKRMASHFNAGLVPDVLSEKPRFWFGKPKGSERGELQQFNYSVSREIEGFHRSFENYNTGINENDFTYYTIETDDLYDIGDCVKFKDKKLFVFKAKAEIIDGILKHEYTLASEGGLSQDRMSNINARGVSVDGKVIGIKEDKLRLHLEIDKKQNEQEAYWFPYSTPYTTEGNTGWYCMPELGDFVKLYFPTANEDEGIVINSIRRRTVGGDYILDPDKKIFRTRFGKEIMFDKDEIVITGKDDEILIRLIEDKGIEIYSKKDIRIIADRNILMESGKTIQISAETGIGLKCKESTIELDGSVDIKGKQVKTN